MSSESNEPVQANIYIYGSCVSRDTFEYLPKDKFKLVGYTARHSLISAFSHGTSRYAEMSDLTGFRRRLLDDDASAGVLQRINAARNEIDLLVIDIIDERLGVYTSPSEGVLTRSLEAMQSGIDRSMRENMEHIPFGSDEHFARWRASLEQLLRDLRAIGLIERTLFLGVEWAELDTNRNNAAASFGVHAGAANAQFARYYDAIESSAGNGLFRLPANLVRADPNHRWGSAPFHYDDATYWTIAAEIAARASVHSAKRQESQGTTG